MPMLRLAPSGPAIVGTSNGQLLRWNSTTLQWDLASDAPYLLTEFDYLLSTRADLVAVVTPVAGDFILPAGSYFFKESIALLDGERIVVDGTDVLLAGGGNGRGLIGNFVDHTPWFVAQNGAKVVAQNMTFGAAATARHGIGVSTGATFVATDCVIPSTATGTQAAIEVAGYATLTRCQIGGGVGALGLSGGADVRILDSRLQCTANGLPCVSIDATLATQLHLDRCTITMTNSQAQPLVSVVSAEDIECRLVSTDCYYYKRFYTNSALVRLSGTTGGIELSCSRDRFRASIQEFGSHYGVEVAGDVSAITIDNCDFDYPTTALYRTSGTVGNVAFNGNLMGANMATPSAVYWPTASLPAQGLFETNNSCVLASPFFGHTTADALVMRRCNFAAGAPLTETALIP